MSVENLSTNYKSFIKNEIKKLLTFYPKEWMSAFQSNPNYPLFVRGDIDGFIALFIIILYRHY
jgi:hypothetical protein